MPERTQRDKESLVRMKEALRGILIIQDLHLKNVKKLHQLMPETIGHHLQESLVRRKETVEDTTIQVVQDLHLKNVKKLHQLVPETIGLHRQESLAKKKETLKGITIQIVPIPGLQSLTKRFQWIIISTNQSQHLQDQSLPKLQDKSHRELQGQSLPELQESRQLQQIQIQIQHLRQLI